MLQPYQCQVCQLCNRKATFRSQRYLPPLPLICRKLCKYEKWCEKTWNTNAKWWPSICFNQIFIQPALFHPFSNFWKTRSLPTSAPAPAPVPQPAPAVSLVIQLQMKRVDQETLELERQEHALQRQKKMVLLETAELQKLHANSKGDHNLANEIQKRIKVSQDEKI